LSATPSSPATQTPITTLPVSPQPTTTTLPLSDNATPTASNGTALSTTTTASPTNQQLATTNENMVTGNEMIPIPRGQSYVDITGQSLQTEICRIYRVQVNFELKFNS
jgi:hypothetical protein